MGFISRKKSLLKDRLTRIMLKRMVGLFTGLFCTYAVYTGKFPCEVSV